MPQANRGQIEIEAHLKVSSRFCYSTDHSREDIEKPGYFIPLHDWFARGDILRVVTRRAGEMATCEFFITKSTRGDVRLQKAGDWQEIGDGGPAGEPRLAEAKPLRAGGGRAAHRRPAADTEAA